MFWGVLFVSFSVITLDKAFSHKPAEDLHGARPPSSCSFSLSFLVFTAPRPGLLETACGYRGPGWKAGHPSPAVSKGRELKGGEDRERGRDAEERHQFSIPQPLQIFTLVFFPRFPPGRVRRDRALQRGNFLGAGKDLLSSSGSPRPVVNSNGCYCHRYN